jgi:hypothetical protein
MNRKTGSAVQGNSVDRPRRAFVKTAAYVAPAILTLKAVPSFASNGSAPVSSTDKPKGKGFDPPHGKGPKNKKPKKEKNQHAKGPRK